jgi:hypothetical protein
VNFLCLVADPGGLCVKGEQLEHVAHGGATSLATQQTTITAILWKQIDGFKFLEK